MFSWLDDGFGKKLAVLLSVLSVAVCHRRCRGLNLVGGYKMTRSDGMAKRGRGFFLQSDVGMAARTDV